MTGLPQPLKFIGSPHRAYVPRTAPPGNLIFGSEFRGLRMRRLLVALIAAVSAMATQVFAADMPTKAPVYQAPVVIPYNWTGFYVGGHVGYLWGRTRVEEDGEVTEPGAPTDGVIGGVLAGYNWQNGPLVLGLDGDFGWTNAHGTGTPAPLIVKAPNTYDLNWTAHLRGRLGYAADHWLFL